MYKEYSVQQTKPFAFNPSKIKIWIGGKRTIPAVIEKQQTGTEMVDVIDPETGTVTGQTEQPVYSDVVVTPAYDVREVQTELTEEYSNLPASVMSGILTETKKLLIPVDTIAMAIDGYDPQTDEPIINLTVLNQIFAGFNLQLS